MYLHRFFSTIICFTLAFGTLFAQNEGREFWFTDGLWGAQNSYMNHQSLDSAIIYVLGQTPCTGYIENPYTHFHVDFIVQPGVMTKVMIPENVISPPISTIIFPLVMATSSVLQGGTIVIRTTQNAQVWVQSYNCPLPVDTNNIYNHL